MDQTSRVPRLLIALLVLGTAFGVAAMSAPSATPDVAITNSVVLTRADASVVAVAQQIRVWCGPWERDVPTPSIHVRFGDPASRTGWSLHAVVADVKRRPVVRFPHDFIFDKPSRAKLGGVDGPNEFTTAEEQSSGRVTFTRVRCGRRLEIRFRVDAVMGSEFLHGAPMTVRGSFSARG